MPNPFTSAVKRARGPSPANEKAGDLTLTDTRGWTLVHGDSTDGPQDFKALVLDAFRTHPVVSAAIREIQSSVSEARLYAYQREPDGTVGERLVDHPAEAVIWEPNDRDTYVDIIEGWVQNFLLGGNAFWRKERDGFGFTSELYPIRPDYVVGAPTDDNEVPLAYRVADGKRGRERLIDATDIIHIADQDPLNAVFGMPRLLAASREIAADTEATKYVGEILSNHGSPGIVIGVSEDTDPHEIERGEERFEAKFGPGQGRGKVAFVAGGTGSKLHNIGFSLENLEFTKLRTITREGICASLGVDPKLIAVGSATPGGGSLGGTEHKEARKKLWSQTIAPMFRRGEAKFDKWLAPEFGDDIVYRFDVSEVEALQEDRLDMFERADAMKSSSVFTSAEIRSETGYSPEPSEDDDTPIVGKTDATITRQEDFGAEQDEGAEQPAPDDDGSGDDDDGEDEDERASSPPFWTDRRAGKGLRFTASDADEREMAWKAFDSFARSMEPDYERQARLQLELERREVVSLARATLIDSDDEGQRSRGVPFDRKEIDEDSVKRFRSRLRRLYDDYEGDWEARYRRLTEHTTEVVGGQVAGSIGASFDVFDETVARFIRERPKLLAGNVTDSTFRSVMGALEDGLREGESTQAIAARIDDVFGRGYSRGGVQILSARERATLIARTETTAVTNGAAVATVNSSDVGVDYWKVWLSQGDDRVRPEHEEMDGEKAEPEETFSNGLDYPAEPNCRCTVVFEQKKKDESD